MEILLNVNGMTCGHCKASVEEAVGEVAGVETVEVDLDKKTVKVLGVDFDENLVRTAIDDIGFDVE